MDSPQSKMSIRSPSRRVSTALAAVSSAIIIVVLASNAVAAQSTKNQPPAQFSNKSPAIQQQQQTQSYPQSPVAQARQQQQQQVYASANNQQQPIEQTSTSGRKYQQQDNDRDSGPTEDPLSDSEPALYGSVAGAPGVDFPAYTKIPKTSFTCEGKGFDFGYYADEEAQCQVYHVCWSGRHESFLCGVGTVFNQAILACDYWHSVDCSKSSQFYSVNSELGKAGAEPAAGGSSQSQRASPPRSPALNAARLSGQQQIGVGSLPTSSTGYSGNSNVEQRRVQPQIRQQQQTQSRRPFAQAPANDDSYDNDEQQQQQQQQPEQQQQVFNEPVQQQQQQQQELDQPTRYQTKGGQQQNFGAKGGQQQIQVAQQPDFGTKRQVQEPIETRPQPPPSSLANNYNGKQRVSQQAFNSGTTFAPQKPANEYQQQRYGEASKTSPRLPPPPQQMPFQPPTTTALPPSNNGVKRPAGRTFNMDFNQKVNSLIESPVRPPLSAAGSKGSPPPPLAPAVAGKQKVSKQTATNFAQLAVARAQQAGSQNLNQGQAARVGKTSYQPQPQQQQQQRTFDAPEVDDQPQQQQQNFDDGPVQTSTANYGSPARATVSQPRTPQLNIDQDNNQDGPFALPPAQQQMIIRSGSKNDGSSAITMQYDTMSPASNLNGNSNFRSTNNNNRYQQQEPQQNNLNEPISDEPSSENDSSSSTSSAASDDFRSSGAKAAASHNQNWYIMRTI